MELIKVDADMKKARGAVFQLSEHCAALQAENEWLTSERVSYMEQALSTSLIDSDLAIEASDVDRASGDGTLYEEFFPATEVQTQYSVRQVAKPAADSHVSEHHRFEDLAGDHSRFESRVAKHELAVNAAGEMRQRAEDTVAELGLKLAAKTLAHKEFEATVASAADECQQTHELVVELRAQLMAKTLAYEESKSMADAAVEQFRQVSEATEDCTYNLRAAEQREKRLEESLTKVRKEHVEEVAELRSQLVAMDATSEDAKTAMAEVLEQRKQLEEAMQECAQRFNVTEENNRTLQSQLTSCLAQLVVVDRQQVGEIPAPEATIETLKKQLANSEIQLCNAKRDSQAKVDDYARRLSASEQGAKHMSDQVQASEDKIKQVQAALSDCKVGLNEARYSHVAEVTELRRIIDFEVGAQCKAEAFASETDSQRKEVMVAYTKLSRDSEEQIAELQSQLARSQLELVEVRTEQQADVTDVGEQLAAKAATCGDIEFTEARASDHSQREQKDELFDLQEQLVACREALAVARRQHTAETSDMGSRLSAATIACEQVEQERAERLHALKAKNKVLEEELQKFHVVQQKLAEESEVLASLEQDRSVGVSRLKEQLAAKDSVLQMVEENAAAEMHQHMQTNVAVRDLTAEVARLQKKLARTTKIFEETVQVDRDQISRLEEQLALQMKAGAVAEVEVAAIKDGAEVAQCKGSRPLSLLARRLLFLVVWSLIQYVMPLVWRELTSEASPPAGWSEDSLRSVAREVADAAALSLVEAPHHLEDRLETTWSRRQDCSCDARVVNFAEASGKVGHHGSMESDELESQAKGSQAGDVMYGIPSAPVVVTSTLGIAAAILRFAS